MGNCWVNFINYLILSEVGGPNGKCSARGARRETGKSAPNSVTSSSPVLVQVWFRFWLTFGLRLAYVLFAFWLVFGLRLACDWLACGLRSVCVWLVFGVRFTWLAFAFGLFLVCVWLAFGLH